ncbi:hypothetical protein [Inhella gelatinilytica]|uniref:SPOR domain-containing protein n=1 Tax=Inhella gelatinilytica TaxID=2795030 RepID=A0A931NE29_9BURK|nr:hypothetical protein [Inhella gelatinilytica]MBH9553249.1 hypothetical protein [Inhella gelatinilytica]
MTVTLADIERVVREWHNRHPLARRVRGEAIHSVGWVGLPYMRASQAAEPSLDAPAAPPAPPRPKSLGWHRWRRGNGGAGPWRVFSETFIDGIAPRAVDAFAGHCAWVHVLEGTEDWPLRRIQVDERLAEACHGAWPTERWLLTAAIEYRGDKIRVLIGESQGKLKVLGRHRHWDRLKLTGTGLLIAGAGALGMAAILDRPSPSNEPVRSPQAPASAPSARSSGSPTPLAPASAPATAASASAAPSAPSVQSAAPASDPPEPGPIPSAPVFPPAAASAAPGTANTPSSGGPPHPVGTSSPGSKASVPLRADGEPDIRPRLGPVHRVRPPKPAASELVGPPPAEKASRRSPKSAIQSEAGERESAPPALTGRDRPRSGADKPEHIRAAPTAAGPQVALVSPAFAKKAEAEERLSQMQAHLQATVREGDLQGEVFETPQGWRAAVWPFATRAEAQIVNATMVARGWKTRAVDF